MESTDLIEVVYVSEHGAQEPVLAALAHYDSFIERNFVPISALNAPTQEQKDRLALAHVAVVAPPPELSATPQQLERLLADVTANCSAPVILITDSPAVAELSDAAAERIFDVMQSPSPIERLVFEIERSRIVQRGSNQLAFGVGGADGSSRNDAGSGTVCAVISTRGGVGRTTIATNLAACFARYYAHEVALMDFDLYGSDDLIAFGMPDSNALQDLLLDSGEVDGRKLAGYLQNHNSGVKILGTNAPHETLPKMLTSRLEQILHSSKEENETIIVDTPSNLGDITQTVIARAQQVVVVSSPEIVSLRRLESTLLFLERQSFPAENTRLVLNHADMTNGIDRGRIEAAIGRHFDVSIPVDAGFVRGLNSGKVHVIERPDSVGARAIAELAESLDPNLPHRRELDSARQRLLHPIRYRRYMRNERPEHTGDRAA